MNPPSVDVKNLLVAADSSSSGTIWDFGETLFISLEPDTPDRCLTIFDTGGWDPDVVGVFERPTIQIKSRDKADQYQRAYDTIKEVIDFLHGERFTTNSTVYVFYQQSDIFYLGRDEDNRVMLTVNILINRTPS